LKLAAESVGQSINYSIQRNVYAGVMATTIGDLVLQLVDDPGPGWRDEILATNTAELERLRAESTAALETITSSDIRLNVGALIQEVIRAVAAITTDDLVRYARRALNDPETRDTGEIVLALGTIWLWGERPKPSRTASETLDESEPETELRLAIANAALLRWFAGLSLPLQASLLQLLAASSAELDALGVWNSPGASNTHLSFIVAFVIATSALVATRRE
jgi:hypothetical protein